MSFGDSLRKAIDKIKVMAFADRDSIKEVVREIQRALIQSDVEINLVLKLSKEIEEEALKEPPKEYDRKTWIAKLTIDKLISILGGSEVKVDDNPERILMIGLFGSGKTTSISKITKYYQKRGKKVGVICADLTRPAAFEQLHQNLKPLDVEVFGSPELSGKANNYDIKKIVKDGLEKFKACDLVICDSAGRSGLDEELREEIIGIAEVFKPKHSWLVINADLGQAAKKQAKGFKESVGVEGIIITKMDGSAKAGGALSACHEAQAPVLFIGMGEKINDFEVFDAARYLQRVMGYGDIQSLLEKVAEIEIEKESMDPEKMLSGEFNLKMFKEQLKATKQLGPFSKVAEMMGLKQQMPSNELNITENKMKDFEILMSSMTKQELNQPDLLNSSRIKRIAKGSGKNENDVRELLKHFKQMKKMFKQFKGMAGSIKDEKDIDMQKLMKKMKFKGMGKKPKFRIK